jgi:radical SAM superfamily enzyme YgiQ (UPF0313 family)
MAKIILIDPFGWQGASSGNNAFPNIGIAYLIPVLHKTGHNIKIIDLNNEYKSDNEILKIIHDYNPNIIGFSVKTSTMKYVRDLSKKIKEKMPKTVIILGGPHATLTWYNLIQEPLFDIIFVGEGEDTLPILCNNIIENIPINDLPGVITKDTYKDKLNLNYPFVSLENNLNILSFPEYDLFPQNVKDSIKKSYPLVTSRGCVYQCIYCSVPKISGKKFRKRSCESIIEELKFIKAKYSIKKFEIVDDIFNFDINRCKEICLAFIKENLNLKWTCPNGLRADRVDKELAELMFKSGCCSVMIGIENTDPNILKTIKKGETIEDIEKGVKIFKKAGINVGGYFIIGLPGDSFQSQKESIKFVKKMRINAFFNMLVPYPETELWNWAKTNTRFLKNIENGLHFTNDLTQNISVIETDDFSASERQEAYKMVHTCLKKFNMIIPKNIPRYQYYYKISRMLWKYDKKSFLIYFLKCFCDKLKKIYHQ